MSNTVRNIEISKAEEVGAAIIDEQPQDYSIVQEWADKLGIELPQESAHVTPIKELSALVNGLVRKVLNMFLPQIVNKTEETYSHLDSRCTDYTPAAYDPFRLPAGPYDPMRPFVPRTLPNLLTALTAFSARKISNGSATNDGIPDGTSLAHLLCSTDAANAVTEIVDDNYGWTMTKNILSFFPNTKKLEIGCKQVRFSISLNSSMFSSSIVEELDMDIVETITDTGTYPAFCDVFSSMQLNRVSLSRLRYNTGCLFNGGKLPESLTLQSLEESTRAIAVGVSGLKKLYCPVFRRNRGTSYKDSLLSGCPDLEEAYIPNLTDFYPYGQDIGPETLRNMPKLHTLEIGKVAFVVNDSAHIRFLGNCGSLIKLVLTGDLNQNLYLNSWSPTLDSSNLDQFLQNFKEHIALRLTSNGSGLTLTLSQAVFSAIWDANGDPQIYQDSPEMTQCCADIDSIMTTKQWEVNKAS